jgi:uncharacterized protein
MLYVIHALDKPASGKIRDANRAAHVEYVKSQSVKLLLAGPLLADDNETSIGTLLVVDAPSRQLANDYANNDPYAKASLFKEVHVTAWKKTFDTPALATIIR